MYYTRVRCERIQPLNWAVVDNQTSELVRSISCYLSLARFTVDLYDRINDLG